MSNSLNVENITKYFGQFLACSNINAELNEGDCLVLCGGNGAGKSTFIKLLTGIFPVTSGEFKLNNFTLIENRKQFLENIGYMPDEAQFPNSLKIRELLAFYSSLRGCSKERVKEVLSLVGLEDKSEEKISNLSKGMRQRVNLAQALIGNPVLLVLDEPTNGLDPNWINQFISILKELKNQGKIIIFSTHMMDVAVETATQIIFMEKGSEIKRFMNVTPDMDLVNTLLTLHRGNHTNILV